MPPGASAALWEPGVAEPAQASRASPSAGAAEAIADGAHREDRRRIAGTAELATQVADVDVHDVRRGIMLVPPHRGEDLLARDDLPVVADQEHEQLELRR